MPQVLENIELRRQTTLRLGGIVPFLYEIRTEEDLRELPALSEKIGMEIRILGGGSNLLITDESLGHKDDILNFSVAQIKINYEDEGQFKEAFIWKDDILVPPLAYNALQENEIDKLLRVKALNTREIDQTLKMKALKIRESDKALRVHIGAGMPIQKFIKLCADKGCTGLEGLMGIPGRVGGAIAMNAGGYECEIDNVLETVQIYTDEHGFLTLTRDDFKNTYRCFTPYHNGVALKNYIICGASFVLPVVEREKVRAKMQELLITKKQTQPIRAYTAGCVFKNPILEDGTTVSAGLLLDQAGFRGKELNGMRFSPIHANFLENFDNGNAKSALELIEEAEEKIFSTSRIKLEREIKLWL